MIQGGRKRLPNVKCRLAFPLLHIYTGSMIFHHHNISYRDGLYIQVLNYDVYTEHICILICSPDFSPELRMDSILCAYFYLETLPLHLTLFTSNQVTAADFLTNLPDSNLSFLLVHLYAATRLMLLKQRVQYAFQYVIASRLSKLT